MYLITLIGGMLFFLPILALYFEENLFTITNVAIIFAVQSIAMVFFEIPTGAIADLFGRKKTIIFAHSLALVALYFLYVGETMKMFILYALLNAFARSLSSGTDSAFLYDTLKQENKEKYYKKIIGTFSALWPVGASMGAIIGGYLAKISLSTPVLWTFVPFSIVFILLFFLKEPKYEKEEHRNIFRHMFESSKLIIANKQIIILLIAGFILFAFNETTHVLQPIFFEFKGMPVLYFGYIVAAVFGFSAIGHYFSHDISEKIGNKATLILATIGTPLFLFLATLTTNFTSVILFVIPSLFHGLRNPVNDHLLNLEVESRKRATILSSSNFMRQLGLAIFAPFVGYWAELYTINTAFMISAVLLFSVPILFLFLKEKN